MIRQWVTRIIKDIVFGIVLPHAYRRAARQPVEPGKVLLIAVRGDGLTGNLQYLKDYLGQSYNLDVSTVLLHEYSVSKKRYLDNCLKMIRRLATAQYAFLDDASAAVSCVPLRSETKIVQLWHACGAFKKFGMSTADLKFGSNRTDKTRHPFYGNLSLVTVSSPEVTGAYVEAMALEDRPEIVQPLGVCRTDEFFSGALESRARRKLADLVPFAEGKKVILYAPTFRGKVSSAAAPDKLDVRAFKQGLSGEYVLLIKHHPFVEEYPSIPDDCKEFACNIADDFTIEEALCIADVCISDYSSLVFEYSLFGRPLVFFAYDRSDYDDWRGFYYDYDALTPGPVFTENAPMIEYLQHADSLFDADQVAAFRERFMSACDGRATERICNKVFGAASAGLRKEDALQRYQAQHVGEIDISIVTPAHNAALQLPHALQSLQAQTYAHERMQIVVVDDGSTDATAQVVHAAAEEFEGKLVYDRLDTCSGSPATPRNRGLELATGTYVFFLDADDWLGPEAVERMMRHAVEWDSDVLQVGVGSRIAPSRAFQEHQPKVDIFMSGIMHSFSPCKLFKRSLISTLRFPHHLPEDSPFVLKALCAADTVSVASDYDYCHITYSDTGDNVSLAEWENLVDNYLSYKDLFAVVDKYATAEQRNKTVLPRIFRRDVLNSFIVAAGNPTQANKDAFQRIVELCKPYYDEGLYSTCPLAKRLILDAGILESYDLLCNVVHTGEDLPNCCTYRLEDDKLYCSLPADVGSMMCDISHIALPYLRLMEVGPAEGGVQLRGYLRVPQPLAQGTICLAINDKANTMQPVHVACTIETVTDTPAMQDVPCVALQWTCAVSPQTFEQIDAKDEDAMWQIWLVFSQGSYIAKRRLGRRRLAGTARDFKRLNVANAQRPIQPVIERNGGFSFFVHAPEKRS